MSLLSRPSRSLRAAAGAALLLAASLAAVGGHAAPAALPADEVVAPSRGRDVDALAQARIENEAAQAALEAAKRIAAPGHLLDPLPARLMAGLGELQAEYAEMDRKAAGYRATLGDQHPTLKGAEEVLAELRGQILDEARRVVVSAQQDATRAQAVLASLERQARAAEATGSIAPSLSIPRPAAAAQGTPAAVPSQPAPRREAPEGPRVSASIPGRSLARTLAEALPLILRHPWLAAAAGLLAAGAALGSLAALVRPRRRRPSAPVPLRIEPAAPVETASASQQPGSRLESAPSTATRSVGEVPVLATLPLWAGDGPAAVLTRLDRGSDAALEQGATSVFATLAAAAGLDRVTVAVTSAGGAPAAEVDAAALALAAAAAGAGRRVLLVDGHPDERLGRALARAAAVVAIVEVGGEVRTVMRLSLGGRVMAVLTRAAAVPASGRAPARLPSLEGFDAIVIAGEVGGIDAVVPGLALLVAPRAVAAADLEAAARIAAGETGRPCGVLLVDQIEAPIADIAEAPLAEAVTLPPTFEPLPLRHPAAPEAAAARHGKIASIGQRHLASLSDERRDRLDGSTPSRFGLRRTFEPVRRRA